MYYGTLVSIRLSTEKRTPNVEQLFIKNKELIDLRKIVCFRKTECLIFQN